MRTLFVILMLVVGVLSITVCILGARWGVKLLVRKHLPEVGEL